MELITSGWTKLSYLLVHMAKFEFYTVLLATALASWHLATVLDKHNARLKEAKLARRIAVFYFSFSLVIWLASLVLS